MSMYADLLVASLRRAPTDDEPEPQQVGELLALLLACRHRLGGTASGDVGPEADIAANIDYDLALLRLCATRGIEADPRRFDRPLAERHRLERELAATGIEIDDWDSAG